MTYEENLRKTAEDIYNEAPDIKRWRDIEAFYPIAEYCLKKQAEVYREAFIIGFSFGYDSIVEAKERVTVRIKTLGLIP